jgi:hypothetical protein
MWHCEMEAEEIPVDLDMTRAQHHLMLASFIAHVSLVLASSGLTMFSLGTFGLLDRGTRVWCAIIALVSLPLFAAILVPRAVDQTIDNLLFGTAAGMALGLANMFAIGHAIEVRDRRRRERLCIGASLRPPSQFPRGLYVAVAAATIIGWPLSFWP